MPADTDIMKPVKSSNIVAIGYHNETQTLLVTFKNSGTYAYDDVPPEEHEKLMAADSVGKHFSTHIRTKFTSTRVPTEKKEPEPVNVMGAG
jgi:KTSC domain